MSSVITTQTAVRVGDVTVPGRFCRPQAAGPFPSVVVMHGSDGFKTNHLKIAERLAGQGLAAFVPTWFGYHERRARWEHLQPEDIPAAIADFQSQADVDPDRTAFLGVSRGGGLALYYGSQTPGTRAIVNYFGLTAWQGGLAELPHLHLNPDDHLDFVKNITCPVLSFHGDADNVVPLTNTYLLDDACRRYGVSHEFVIYPGVNHSFIWDDIDNEKYDRPSHLDSWERAMRFLKQQLF
jgi:dienelactone hydrolase